VEAAIREFMHEDHGIILAWILHPLREEAGMTGPNALATR
jgi:hypothetical protein